MWKGKADPHCLLKKSSLYQLEELQRAGSSTDYFSEVRAIPLPPDTYLLSIPISYDEQSAAAREIPTSNTLSTWPCLHRGNEPTPGTKEPAIMGCVFLLCNSSHRWMGSKKMEPAAEQGSRGFPLAGNRSQHSKAATSVTGVGHVFCFNAAAGRGESQARQPSTESFCRQKDTYTG